MVSSTSIWATATLRMVRIRFRVVSAWGVSPVLEPPLQVCELVEQLLEPQLVHLVDHDEQHLVVLVRARVLRSQHVVERQV